MNDPRHLVDSDGDRDTQTGRAATSTSHTIPAAHHIPELRRCTFTDTWCRCTAPESPTMVACARHFLGEVA